MQMDREMHVYSTRHFSLTDIFLDIVIVFGANVLHIFYFVKLAVFGSYVWQTRQPKTNEKRVDELHASRQTVLVLYVDVCLLVFLTAKLIIFHSYVVQVWIWRCEKTTLLNDKSVYVNDVTSPDGHGSSACDTQYLVSIVYGHFILTLSYQKLSYTIVVKYCILQAKLQCPIRGSNTLSVHRFRSVLLINRPDASKLTWDSEPAEVWKTEGLTNDRHIHVRKIDHVHSPLKCKMYRRDTLDTLLVNSSIFQCLDRTNLGLTFR